MLLWIFLLLASLLISNSDGVTTSSGYGCYNCLYTITGTLTFQESCKDPFSTSGASVDSACTTTCFKLLKKQGTTYNLVRRGCWNATEMVNYGLSTCSDGTFDTGAESGELACCDSDLCNRAPVSKMAAVSWITPAFIICIYIGIL